MCDATDPVDARVSIANSRRFVVITPCRDEADHIEATIRTVAAQTCPPTLWIIVNDGSTDGTAVVLERAAASHSFIRVVTRRDRGERKVGPGVIEAFYAGLEVVDLDDYDYVCKLDADLELPPRYFERLMEEMESEPRLGAVSGKIFLRDENGRLSHERRGDEHAVGPSKFYRVVCFREIGGFMRMVGWDGIDGHMCRLTGWIARSIMDDEIKVVHCRLMGSSHRGVLHGRMRGGEGKWRLGSSPWYVLATTVYRMIDPPPVVGALAMAYGYFRAMVRGVPRQSDPAYLKFLRGYEWRALLFGKNRTTAKYNEAIHRRFTTASGAAAPTPRTQR